MFSRVRKLFCGRRRSEDSVLGVEGCPLSACLQVRAVTLDEFFNMLMENRLREEVEELGAGGDAATASASVSHASSGGLDADEPPCVVTPRPAVRQWRWRSPITQRGRRTGHRSVLQRIKKLCCLGVADRDVDADAEEEEQVEEGAEEEEEPDDWLAEERTSAAGPDSRKKKSLLTWKEFFLLSLLLDQLEHWDDDQDSEGDTEDPLPSTSAGVPIIAASTSELPRRASHLGGRRRHRRQRRNLSGQTGQHAGRLRSRRSYRLFPRT